MCQSIFVIKPFDSEELLSYASVAVHEVGPAHENQSLSVYAAALNELEGLFHSSLQVFSISLD